MNPFPYLRRRFGRMSPVACLLAFQPLVVACAQDPPGAVEANWGKSYKSLMQAQIQNPDPDYANDPAPAGTDSLTGELILENYQEDLRRTESEKRETFIIESGVN
jgi:hypothetical protein